MTHNPLFISFEAPEGAGKSTQAKLLKERLDAEGIACVLTREPGGTQVAEELRAIVLQGDPDRLDAETELLIFTAARRDHLRRVIFPALADGKVVICDRYAGSTHALQGAAGVSADLIDQLHASFAFDKLPDMTLFLDIDFEVGLRRSLDRLGTATDAESRFEIMGSQFHRKVYELLQKQCRENDAWVRIDAERSIEKIHDDIWKTVIQRISPVATLEKTG
jgi:dTMP kinase